MGRERIRLESICKSYYGKTGVTQALRKVSLSFSMGEFIAITGESGSGKSTLLNIIGGMDSFDDGEMYVDGEPTFPFDESDWEEYRRTKIGYVFQDYSLIGHYRVIDNMISALIIMGRTKEEAAVSARRYLEMVGLGDYAEHKATELSSGQKQRLSIARALAKETGIIIADEPTGNLDTETGNQIIALLAELSRERLVIMVTHNYEQAAEYVTRKIRIHDGEVVSDAPAVAPAKEEALDTAKEDAMATKAEVEEKGQRKDGSKIQEPAKSEGKKERKETKAHLWRSQWGMALHFALKNLASQPGRSLLFVSFLTVIAVASFLLWGQIWIYEDDITTKNYSNKVFYQKDETRLVLKKSSGFAFTEEELEKLRGLSYVAAVDSCDYANDINYYVTEDEDYEYLYSHQWGQREPKATLKFLKDEKFMRSADCIKATDLAAGRLPESRNEIVLYAEDFTALGTTQQMFFKANNIWDSGEYYDGSFTIVGILKEKTTQIYFSTEWCQMISMYIEADMMRIVYAYDEKKMDYAQKPQMILVVADDLKGNQVRVSKNIAEPVMGEILFRHWDYDEDGSRLETYQEETVEVLKKTTNHSQDFLEVSQEFYDRHYQSSNLQASLYLLSYAKTDEVLHTLEKLGIDGISTIRIGAGDYDKTLVIERLKIMAICAGGLVALIFAEVLILCALMKIRIKDYFILKFMGMRLALIGRISFLEIGICSVIGLGITILGMWVLRLLGNPMICEMMWYYEGGAYLLFALYHMILTILTTVSFYRLLKGRLNQ